MKVEEGSRFGERLRQLREAAGLTQEELAERAGLTAKGVGALETGKRRRPYPHTVRALAEALGLSDAERTNLTDAARGRAGAPIAAQPPGGMPTLPVLPAPLVGREREIAAVVHLLRRAEPRLLTLTGPGGVGKTGLAVAAAAAAADGFPDGVAFVPLAPLSDPGLVVPTTLGVLGVRESADRPAQERLRAHLRGKRMLLILDNFEHLMDAASDVADLLASCAGPTFLVTSRAPLRVRGEQEYPVPPLELPDLERVPDVAEVAGASAVQLFVRRAREVSPDFALTQGNATAVAAVCRRLDGLPLAIELAAAWTKLLPPTALLARLDRTLPILTGGPRDLPARQQTMRDAIAWSHDLLSPTEQALFRRLAVFVGGFDLGGAEAVAVVPADPGVGILDGVASLVDKSLLRRQAGSFDDEATGPRFGMLETVREFALERLVTSGEEAAVRDAHAAWCLALVEEGDRELWGPRHALWSDRLAAEYDNVRAVLAWTLERGRVEIGLRLTRALWKFIRSRGHPSEARRWQQRPAGRRARICRRASASTRCGSPGTWRGWPGTTERPPSCWSSAWCSRAKPTTARRSPRRSTCWATSPRISTTSTARWPSTRRRSRSSAPPRIRGGCRTRFRAWGARRASAATSTGPGRSTRRRSPCSGNGTTPGASPWSSPRSPRWPPTKATSGRAAALFGEGIRLHAELGDLSAVYYGLFGMGKLAAADGRAEAAARLLGTAAALRDARGIALQQDHRGPHERTVARVRGALGEEGFVVAWATGRAWSIGEAVAEAEAVAAAMTTER